MWKDLVAPMVEIQVAELGWTGRVSTRAFHALFDGNTGHPPIEGAANTPVVASSVTQDRAGSSEREGVMAGTVVDIRKRRARRRSDRQHGRQPRCDRSRTRSRPHPARAAEA